MNGKIGKNFQEWYREKVKDLHDKVKAKRADIFGIFVRKTRINQFMDDESLKTLETSMYQRQVDNVKELIKSKIPSITQEKYISLGIDWTEGKDIQS